ncbi:M23 family metallopeptidase [Metabacillus iocasae]|uniref:Stage II sporulation protein Q n=1 Tax=Priestia iocasae TaxID=2291674 RepID=A0ABS2QX38_9BACI|nr:M23 family metallopeptidase [Metabacillus iocasae]MBM7704031.1 stage II sporulation protein Q [Metabacillus iocasae]
MREEEKNRISQSSKLQKLLRKRWVFPAIYLMSAAIILTAVLWFQANGPDNAQDKQNDVSEGTAYDPTEDAVEVNSAMENLAMPVLEEVETVIQKSFYDDQASKEEQEAALVFYNNTYHPNTGIDITAKDGSSFDVVAAASGTVTNNEKDPLLGYVVEVEHADGVVTNYQSLENVSVEVGDTVKQGQVIGKAGQNIYNQEAKTHVHFEVRKDGVAVNPNSYFGKTLSTIKVEADTTASEEEKEDGASESESTDKDEQSETEESSDEEKGESDVKEEDSSTSFNKTA